MISLEGLRVGRLKGRDASQRIPEPRWYSGVEKHSAAGGTGCLLYDNLGLNRRLESTLQTPAVSACLNRKEVSGLLLLYIGLLVTFFLFSSGVFAALVFLWPGVITTANSGSGRVLSPANRDGA